MSFTQHLPLRENWPIGTVYVKIKQNMVEMGQKGVQTYHGYII